MSFGNMSLGSLLIIALLIILIFGSKRLSHLGEDLARAIKGFRKGLQDDDTDQRKSD